MERPRLSAFYPQWEGPFENYARSWIARQGWRVRHCIGSDEDQLQECALVFSKIRNRYKFNNGAHFMGMFKTALFRHWASLSPKDWEARQHTSDEEIEGEFAKARICPTEKGGAELATALGEVSEELQAVLRLIFNTPNELLSFVLNIDDERALERRLCWLAGVTQRPVLRELREVLEDA